MLKLPKIGLGTMQGNSKAATEAFAEGIRYGFRFIDTAQIYFNEKTIGKAIKDSEIPRDELIIATKLWISNFNPRKVQKSIEGSLKRLHLDFVDIFYLHWPWRFKHIEQTFKAMDKLVKNNKIKHIGVSNFTIKQIEIAETYTENHIIANQVEMHPWLQQEKMLPFLKQKNIQLIAYFPLMHGYFNNVPELHEIAKKHNINSAQVSLAWIMQKQAIPIPKSANIDHLKINFDSTKISLDKEDIKLIDSITKRRRFASFPIIAPKWDD